jgi:predicted anti-sigma-YlaC factor YlaD
MRGKALVLIAALCASGCSVKRRAISSLGNSLSIRLSSSFASEDDPELVRAAAPFSLKLIESLIAENPRDEELLLIAARGFTQYSYAFVQQDAEEAEVHEQAMALRARAAKLYLRARDYGMRALEVKHPNFAQELKANPREATAKLGVKEVPLMYWTGLSWAGALGASKDVFMVPQIPQFEALMDRALQLDESFQQGAIHTFFIGFEMSSPTRQGEKAARAKEHFDRAVVLSKGRSAGPYVSYAEAVMAPAQKRAEFEALLRAALRVDVNAEPEKRLQNLIFKRRAKWLQSRADKLFK